MNWRTSGDTTLTAFRALLPANSEIVKRGETEAVYAAGRPYTRLMAGMLAAESSFATDFNNVPASMNNPLNLRVMGHEPFQHFNSIAACVAEWKARITSPNYAYRDTVTVRDLIEVYAPSSDNNDVDQYVATVEAVINRLPRMEEPQMAITFGKVPHPPFSDRPITKAEGNGQNNLGKRTVKGVVWHRILGSLWGTDSYFRNDSVAALTDYGVGVLAQDGITNDGLILRWNDPLGYQSGWASGPLSAPYGDGLAFYNKYGINAINKDQASIEISGYQNTPLSEKARNAIAGITAYWADQYGIPWNEFPIAPQDGFSFVRWHQEFTIGSGKECPFAVVMDETPALIERTKAIMQQYQESAAPGPEPEPEPEQPKHEIPKGKTVELLRRQYGRAVNPVTGEDEGFDLGRAAPQVWLAYGKRTGRWPELTKIIRRGDGSLLYQYSDGHDYMRFPDKEH